MFRLKRAKDEARTRDNQLGRLELYQLSYFRIKTVNKKPQIRFEALERKTRLELATTSLEGWSSTN